MTGSGLRRFVGAAPAPPAQVDEHCEMCDTPVPEEHSHVVDLQNRALMCACRACFLLFTSEESGAQRYRAVPDRYLVDERNPLSRAEWDALGVPVSSAFFLRASDGSTAAFYPSPAGATECLLDLAAWSESVQRHPLLGAARPDVEAILVNGGVSGDEQAETFLVPIDACYQLVGTVRVYWQGFDGGEEARDRIAEFFAEVRARARPLARER